MNVNTATRLWQKFSYDRTPRTQMNQPPQIRDDNTGISEFHITVYATMLQCWLSRALRSFSFHICFIKAYVNQQDCQSNNFPSWQDRFFSHQVKLRSSLIEAMAERYMESPESPAFFTVGSFSYQQNCNCTTAWNLVREAANSASHPILCARTI